MKAEWQKMATQHWHCESCGRDFSLWRIPGAGSVVCDHCGSSDVTLLVQ